MPLPMENITVDLLPKGERPVLHVAQFDNARAFFITLQNNGVDYPVPEGVTVELRVRKVDGHVVTIAPDSVTSNVCQFTTTEQMCACYGHNIGEIALIYGGGPMCSILIDIEVQRDVLQGGVDSATDIYNLTTQITDIVGEVLGDDYYTKVQTDAAISAGIAAEVPDLVNTLVPPAVQSELGNYYNKSEVDTLLSGKADTSDLPDMTQYYDKTETDTLLSAKANTSDLANYYTKSEVDTALSAKVDKTAIAPLIVQKNVAKAALATFNTDITDALTKCIVYINAVQAGSGTPSPSNPRAISGFSSANISVADENMSVQKTTTISLGTTVYSGVLNVNTGKLTVTGALIDLGSLSWSYNSGLGIFYTNSISTPISKVNSQDLMCDCYRITTLPISASNTDWSNEQDLTIGKRGDSTTMYLYCINSNYTTAPDFTTDMSGRYLLYTLATPTETTLTPAQVDQIIGQNNVYTDTNGDIQVRFTETIGNELGV